MTDRHFLFTDEMVRRILSGEKTQTRRPMKDAQHQLPPTDAFFREYHWSVPAACFDAPSLGNGLQWCARIVAPGDVLIGRECHRVFGGITGVRVDYRADGEHRIVERETERVGGALVHYLPDVSTMERPRGQWRPSIHMPRWAARIVRPITGVRVERLQDISEADAVAEGFQRQVQGKLEGLPLHGEGEPCDCGDADCPLSARMEFACVWNTIYADRGVGWDANPWVVVVEFEGAK